MTWLKKIIGKLSFFFTSNKVDPPIQEEPKPMYLNLTTGNNARFIREFLNSESLFIYPEENNSISQFCSCLDYLQDIDTGLMETIANCRGTSYQKFISLFGILQALFVKHDAVKNLFETLGEKYHENASLNEIRNLRNLTIGHPTKKEHRNNSKEIVKHSYSQIDIYSCSNLPISFKFLTYTHDEKKTPQSFLDYLENCHTRKEIKLLQEIETQDRELTNKLKTLQQLILKKENTQRNKLTPIVLNIKKQLLEANSSLKNIEEKPIHILQQIEDNLSYIDNVTHDNLNLWEYTAVNFREQNISGIEQLKKIYTKQPTVLDTTDFCIFASFIANKCKLLTNTHKTLPYLISLLPAHIEQVTTKNEGLKCFIFPLQVLKGHLQSNHSANTDAQKIIKLIIRLEQAIANYDMKLTQDDSKIYLSYL